MPEALGRGKLPVLASLWPGGRHAIRFAMTHHTRTYSLVVEPHAEDGGYLAYFPALSGCHAWGETYEEAVKTAEEVLLGYLEALRQNGEEVPVEPAPASDVSLGVTVKLPEPA